MATFGDPASWLIVKRQGVWTVCPPSRNRHAGARGGVFETGAEALAAFAGSGLPLRVDYLTEACRQYEWRDSTPCADRWVYNDGWYWLGDDGDEAAGRVNEELVAKIYPWVGPFTRTTGPGVTEPR